MKFPKFDCFLSPDRMHWILPHMQHSGAIKNFYYENIRKTVSMYGEKFNVYVDASDGIADDFGIKEYCDRILRIVDDAKGKPFLLFKCWYSPTLCEPIVKIAEENGGKVVPFFMWAGPDHDNFTNWEWPNRNLLRFTAAMEPKPLDIGMCVRLEKRMIPKPSKFDERISWKGYEWFGFGPAVDTGYYEHDVRPRFHDMFSKSQLKYQHIQDVSFQMNIKTTLSWKAIIDSPGIACVSHRMLEHGWLGQCVILKKNDVDFAYSWKDYYPQVDFSLPGWEEEVGTIIENHKLHGERILYYLETFCTPEVISQYFFQEIQNFADML